MTSGDLSLKPRPWTVVILPVVLGFAEPIQAAEQENVSSRTKVVLLAAEGFVVLGGPLEGTRDVLLVIRAESPCEIVERLAADRWSGHLLMVKECRPGRIRLGSLGETR
jgi:hypothetical protein